MDDKTLAEKCVALEVITADGEGYYRRYRLLPDSGTQAVPEFMAHQIVTDPRVAMALMERCYKVFIERQTDTVWTCRADGPTKTREWYDNASLPRAIVEACVTALEET